MNTYTKYIVGLTGGIGSGKSTIARKFNQYGIDSLDADDIAREVVAIGTPCLAAITQRYGKDILLADGALNRRALRHIIFENEDEKKWLESLTHPAIHQALIEEIEKSQSLYVLLVHPLLFETQKHTLCDYTIAVSVEKELQLTRVCQRDNVTEKIANAIIASQLSDEARCQQADYVIHNNDDPTTLDQTIFTLHQQLSTFANAKH